MQTFYTAATLEQKYGLTPDQWLEAQILMGDPTDNIKGCRNLGEKRAIEAIKRCGSVEGLLRDHGGCPRALAMPCLSSNTSTKRCVVCALSGAMYRCLPSWLDREACVQ